MAESLLSTQLLAQLADEENEAALARLESAELASPASAEVLTTAALEQAEIAPESAARWLELADTLRLRFGPLPALQAQIAYAQARLRLRAGDLDGAVGLIQQAQQLWASEGSRAPLARSYLGLTQIFTLQGRYAEAESAVQAAIAGLPPGSVPQAQARINLANLLRRQERHDEALAEYAAARHIYAGQVEKAQADGDGATTAKLQGALARLAVNQANALISLDRPDEAEGVLKEAATGFSEAADTLNQGRTHTNLGTLYLRTGRYSLALAALTQAGALLLGDRPPADLPGEKLRQADILFLERANVYVALNLLSEAVQEIEQAIRLFETTGQPYELGQSYYTLGLLRLRIGQARLAQTALAQAGVHFGHLGNGLWQNRVALALAGLAFQQGDEAAARQQVAQLFSGGDGVEARAQHWDTGLRVESQLLWARLALARREVAEAEKAVAQIGHLFGAENAGSFALPHLRLQWEQMTGAVALAGGDGEKAIAHFESAIAMLESQRVSLPLEEFKSGYLEDKQSLYSDLLVSVLAQPGRDGDGDTARAFAIGEQARARSLLERLMAAGESSDSPAEAETRQADQLRRELHWLYNQLVDNPDQTAAAERFQEVQAKEAALQQMEWKRTPLLRQTEAVDLPTFQAALDADQQAIVYWVAQPSVPAPGGGEVMAFVIDRNSIRLVRGLAAPERLGELAGELRFQLGRIELGWVYAQRHRERLMAGVQAVLGQMHRCLIAPLADALWAERLLLIPHGLLHQLPLHSLWDGARYLLEDFECSYAPSASLVVHNRARRQGGQTAYTSWAGLALTDPAIPAAGREVRQAARRFADSRLFVDGDASRQGLREAARADILHLATHGLFRPDNPFFSALKLADGWIDVREIYRLPLAARLVVLSACESGVGRVRGGDEVIGLARGFLGAGAHSLLVSLWNVHDESAADLTDRFYFSLQAGDRPAAALRAAQQLAIATGQHPYFWAPFLAIG